MAAQLPIFKSEEEKDFYFKYICEYTKIDDHEILLEILRKLKDIKEKKV